MEDTQTNAIVVQIQQNNLSSDMSELLQKSFLPFYEQAEQWMQTAKTIEVTDVSQTKEMKLARDARLALKDVRVAVEKKRKELKDESLRTGKAIDGVANVLKGLIEPIELHLQQQEDFAKVQEEKRIAALQVERAIQIQSYIDNDTLAAMTDLGSMPKHQFDALLFGYKTQRENQIAEAKRVEDERIAKEKVDAESRESQRLENERLKKEADDREKELAAQAKVKEKRNAELRPYIVFIRDYNKMLNMSEEDYVKELSDVKAGAELQWEDDRKRMQIEAEENQRRDEQLQKDREEHKRVVAETEARLKSEREAKSKLEKELKDKQDAENKRIAVEEKERKDKIAADKKSARAPDKQKIINYAQTIRNIETPETKSNEAAEILNEGSAMIMKAVKFLMEKANSL